MPNLVLYRTLIQLARVSARLGVTGDPEGLLQQRNALVAKAKTCGMSLSRSQQDHLCARLAH